MEMLKVTTTSKTFNPGEFFYVNDTISDDKFQGTFVEKDACDEFSSRNEFVFL